MLEANHVFEQQKKDLLITPHCHSTIEIDCFVSGRGRYSVAGQEHEIAPGMVFIFSNSIIHRVIDIDEAEPMEIFRVHFSPSILWEDSRFSEFERIFFRTSGCTVISPDSPFSLRILNVLKEMVNEQEKPSYCTEELLREYLYIICIMTARHTQQTEPALLEEQYRGDNHLAIFSTIEYINAHLADNLCIDDLAQMAQMSKNSYLFWFKHFNGVSPYNYIQSKRVLKSLKLLKQNMTVTRVALECGYNSSVSFNKAFKKVMGCTPSSWQRSCSE